MAVVDFLKNLGEDVAKGAATAGRASVPILQRAAEVVSGEAPQIDEEDRKRQEALEDAEINSKAAYIDQQIALGQKYGTLTPDQIGQLISTKLSYFNQPRHADKLFSAFKQAFHPGAMTYQQGGAVPLTSLPSGVPQGGTMAADTAAAESAASRKLADALTEIEARAKATAANREPKPLKSEISGGVFLGVSDPNTGTTYPVSALQPGGNAPPEAKQLFTEYQKGKQAAHEQKVKDQERENQEILHRQEVNNEHMIERMRMQFQNMLSATDYRSARGVIQKLQTNYATSQTLEQRMKQLSATALDAIKNGQHNQQAELAILANHIAMTTHQPGAAMRPTKALFDEAAAAQPWMQKIEKRVDSNGILSGVVLSQQQIQQMNDLAPMMVNADLEALKETKDLMADQLSPEPAGGGGTGAKKLKSLKGVGGPASNVITVSPDDMKNAGVR